MNRQQEIQLAQLLEERRRDLETLLEENDGLAESIRYSFGNQLTTIQTLAGQLPVYTDTAAALAYLEEIPSRLMNRQQEIQLAQLLEERRRDLETLLEENDGLAESIRHSFGNQLAAIQTLAGQLPAYTDTAAALAYLEESARRLERIAGALTRAAAQLRPTGEIANNLRRLATQVEQEAAIAKGHASDLRNYQRPDAPGHDDYIEIHAEALRYWIHELTQRTRAAARDTTETGQAAAAVYTLAASLLKDAQKAARAHAKTIETQRQQRAVEAAQSLAQEA